MKQGKPSIQGRVAIYTKEGTVEILVKSMGRDAVVYKRLENVPLASDASLNAIRVEQSTGEVYFENDEGFLRREDVRVVHKRLGNIALIALLRDEVEKMVPPARHSILLRKVLYDGTHSGDVIPMEDLGELKREIELLKAHASRRQSPELETFLSAMGELATASEQNGNPIVFV